MNLCKKTKLCSNYTVITPSCFNCENNDICTKSVRNKVCKKWGPDNTSPFVSLIKELCSEGGKLETEIFIDDRDFKEAPNWVEFCLNYLSLKPFPKQIQEAMYFLGEFCPKCTNPKYLNLYDQKLGNILDNISFLQHGKCPICGRTKLAILKEYRNDFFHAFNEMTGVAGQRSGKSALGSLLAAYVWHRYTKMEGPPSDFFGLLKSHKIHMTFVALTFGQAKTNLWDPFSSYIENSWWFKDYHQMLKEKSLRLGIPPLVKFEETFLLYKHKKMQVAPVGPDKRILRGPTRFMYEIDELGWFTGGKHTIKINPDEIYRPLNNSLKTIRNSAFHLMRDTKDYNIPTAYAVNISSPYTARDKIMRLLYASRRVKSMYAFHHSTWEMNPNYTIKDFDDEFAKDPVGARRDFGAFPPLSESPFISSLSSLLDNIRSSKQNVLDYNILEVMNKRGIRYISADIKSIKNKNKPVILGLDAGYSRNAFGATLVGYNPESKVVSLEGAIEIKPIDNKPVHFPYTYDHVIVPIIEEMNVLAVYIDRWQSIDISHRIEDTYDIPCYRYSLRYSDFEIIRSLLLEDRTIFPRLETKTWEEVLEGVKDYEDFFVGKPIAHLILQIVTVQDSGRKIEKGSGDVDDDLFRAFSLCLNAVEADEELQDEFRLHENKDDYSLKGKGNIVGVIRGLSTSGIGRNSSNNLFINSNPSGVIKSMVRR
jgi:hypothetical protein